MFAFVVVLLIRKRCKMMQPGRILWTYYLILMLNKFQRITGGSCMFHYESRVVKAGNFSSPDFPSNYPTGADCRYSFEGEEHEGLKLSFYEFDLEPPYKSGCLMDYVDIATINMHNMRHLIGRFCGNDVPSPVLSMQPKLELVFRSNFANQYKGFLGTFEFVDERYVPPPTSTVGVEGCGGLISGAGGIITSPGYPTHFPGNIDCVWLIRVTYTKHIYLRVLDLQLHGSIATCNKAVMAVYDGYSSFNHNPRIIKRYCGDLKYYKNVDDRNALSHRNRLVIRFQVDEASRDTTRNVGFKLVWTEVAFVEKEKCSQFPCKGSEYCLDNRPGASCKPTKIFCIDQSLKCNGIPNCSEGDRSDEEQCNFSHFIILSVGASLGALCVLVAACVYRRHVSVRKSTSQTQALTMQLRQLEHSPSCSNRQLSGSFSQPCDLSPTILELNGTPNYAHTRFVIMNSASGTPDPVTSYSRYKGDPTEV